MKKWKIFGILAFALALFAVSSGPAQAAIQHYYANVYLYDESKRGMTGQPAPSDVVSTAIITYKVLAVGANTAETLYKTSGMTYGASKTNAVTTTVFGTDNYKIDFWCDPTDATDDTYVDLIVVDVTGGYTAVVKKFSPYVHSVYINVTPGIRHQGVIWFDPTTTDETSTGITFERNTHIDDVRVEVVTAAAASTLDVGLLSTGTSGDANGFISAILLTTTGFVTDAGQISAGASAAFVPATNYGALLYTAITGTGAAATNTGGKTYKGCIINGSTTGVLTYSAGVSTAKGYIYTFFTKLR